MLTTSKREQQRMDMTWAMRVADVRHDAYSEGRNEGFCIGLQRGRSQGLQRGHEEGIALGAYQKALEAARALLILGLSPEQIQFCTSLSMETIQTMAQEV